jgi:nucleotide-binding universal stress UspA family protein
MIFKRILVALDYSFQASSVFQRAMEQIKTEDAQLMLVYVVRVDPDLQASSLMGVGTLVDVDMYGTLKQIYQRRVQQEIQKAQTHLQRYAQQARDQSIATDVFCPDGEPGVKICDVAKEWNADLIIVGRRGHQGIREVMLGSVSNYVVHNSPCSVLIVQNSGS